MNTLNQSIGSLILFLFPRLPLLDQIKQKADFQRQKYNAFCNTNHGKTGVSLAKRHEILVAGFNYKKYWFMKSLKHIKG